MWLKWRLLLYNLLIYSVSIQNEMEWEQEGKESFGYAPSRLAKCLICCACGQENCPPMLCGLKAKKNKGTVDMSIGSSSPPSPRRLLWPVSRQPSTIQSMQNSPVPMPLQPTVLKRTPELKGLGSMELNQFPEIPRRTGSLSGNVQKKVISCLFHPVYEWSLIGHLGQLEQIIWRLSQLFVKYGASGAEAKLASLDVLGKKPVWTLTLNAQEVNFGMVIKARKMLLLMNFEEVLTCHTSYDGVTGILAEWRLKEVVDRCAQP